MSYEENACVPVMVVEISVLTVLIVCYSNYKGAALSDKDFPLFGQLSFPTNDMGTTHTLNDLKANGTSFLLSALLTMCRLITLQN